MKLPDKESREEKHFQPNLPKMHTQLEQWSRKNISIDFTKRCMRNYNVHVSSQKVFLCSVFFKTLSTQHIHIVYIFIFLPLKNDEFACLTLGLFIEKNDQVFFFVFLLR